MLLQEPTVVEKEASPSQQRKDQRERPEEKAQEYRANALGAAGNHVSMVRFIHSCVSEAACLACFCAKVPEVSNNCHGYSLPLLAFPHVNGRVVAVPEKGQKY